MYWNSLPFLRILRCRCSTCWKSELRHSGGTIPLLSVCKQSVNFSLEILSLYWNCLPFRGGSIVALPICFKRRALYRECLLYSVPGCSFVPTVGGEATAACS